MTRLASPALIAILLGALLAGFGAGFIVGQSPGTVDAADRGPGSVLRRAAVTPGLQGTEGGLQSGAELAGVGVLEPSGRRAAVAEVSGAGPSPAFLEGAVERAARRGVELPEAPAGSGVIRGRVEDQDGERLAGVLVVATPRRSAVKAARLSSETRSGRFTQSLEEVLADAAESWAKGDGSSVSCETDSSGKFVVEGLGDTPYSLRAERDGFRFTNRRGAVLNPVRHPEVEVLFEGKALGYFELSVVRSDGGPVPDKVLVSVDGRNGERVEWSPDDPKVYVASGQCRVQAMAEPLVTGARGTAYELMSERVAVDVKGDPGQLVTLTLEPTCVVTGFVEGDDVHRTQRSVAAVPLRPDEPFDPSVPPPDGNSSYLRSDVFQFGDLNPGRYAIALIGPGGLPTDHEIVDLGPGVTEVTLQRTEVDPGRWVTVDVTSPRGQVLDDVDIYAEVQKPGDRLEVEWLSDRRLPSGLLSFDTDDFDAFDFDEWPAGTKMWVVATNDIYGLARAELAPGARAVSIQLTDPCHLTVQVNGDINVGGFTVRILDGSGRFEEPRQLARAVQGSRSSVTRIDPSGKAVFKNLSPGPVIVALSRAGRWWGEGKEISRQEITLSGRDHAVTLQAPEVSDLAVLITPCKKERYISLQIEEEDGEKKDVGSTQTSKDGRAVFRGLPPGEYLIRDYRSGAEVTAQVPGPEIRIDLEEYVVKLTVSISKIDGMLAQWGLKGGDHIIAVDGEPVEDDETLLDALNLDSCTVEVLRGDDTVEIELPRYPRSTRDAHPLGGWMYIGSD